MTFELSPLSLDPEGFGDWISEEGFEFHYGKHHAGYVSKLNAALDVADYSDCDGLVDVIAKSRGGSDGVFNNAAQHYNHQFFWDGLTSDKVAFDGLIASKIGDAFGGFDEFVDIFSKVAIGHFGSGWAWLLMDSDGGLVVSDFHDADTPADGDLTPLLALDLWEHAYYIDHRNDRGGFIAGFFEHVDWVRVNALIG